MKKLLYLLLPISFWVFQSCTKDFSAVEVTYTKATAKYSDLSELRSIPLIGAVQTVENPGKIFVSEDLLLIGEEGKGIHIIDNTDPANPQPTLFLNVPGNLEFYVEGDQVFAESHYDMLKIDISNIDRPALVSRVENAFAQDLVNDKGEVLIGFDFEEVTEKMDSDFYQKIYDGQQERYYFDYANQLIPPSAVPASFSGNSNSGIGAVNRIAYRDGFVYVISRANLTSFKDNGTDLEFLSTNTIGSQMETIFPYKENIFIGTQNSMEIFDLSNPSQPRQVASFWHATSCDPVYPIDDVAYVTLRTGDASNCPGDVNSLVVLDISAIDNPTTAQEIEMESPYGLTFFNDQLFVGEGANGLKIFDATDKKNLSLEIFDESIEAYDVIHHPTRMDILLVAGPEGLGQYEIEGTEKLSLVSWLEL